MHNSNAGGLASAAIPGEPEQAQNRLSGLARFAMSNEFGLLILIILFATFFASVTDGFATRFNLFALGRTMAIDIMVGFSMMVVIVTGGLNLSVGAIGVSAAMFGGWVTVSFGLPLPVGILAGLMVGSLMGWINGMTIVKSGVHSFVITLATMSIFFGLMVFLSQAQAIRDLPPEVREFRRFKLIGGYFSPLLLVSIAVGIGLTVMYKLTTIGRQMLAAGASQKAAGLSGIKVNRTIIYCHMLSGGLAALAAVMLASRHGAVIPSMTGHLGQDWLLPAFLAPVLGGTLLTGGRVSVLGTFFGAVLVSMLSNGLLLLQVGEFWILAFLGLLLLIAVVIDKTRQVFLARRNIA